MLQSSVPWRVSALEVSGKNVLLTMVPAGVLCTYDSSGAFGRNEVSGPTLNFREEEDEVSRPSGAFREDEVPGPSGAFKEDEEEVSGPTLNFRKEKVSCPSEAFREEEEEVSGPSGAFREDEEEVLGLSEEQGSMEV